MAAENLKDDKIEIAALFARWSKSLEARDLDGLLAHYSPEVMLFDATPPYAVRGIASYRRAWEKTLACLPAEFKSEHRDVKIHASGEAAFAHCLHRIVPIGEEHPMAGRTWLRATICFSKAAGEWKITHEHVSLPFDPETGKADFIPNP
jgi:ketosteroid isomerase-like protein